MQNKLKFVHIRMYDEDGVIKGHGGATVAFISQSGKVLRCAAALCNPKDNFNRKYGRIKSAGRLASPNWSVCYDVETGPTEKEFIKGLRTTGVSLLTVS